MSLLNAFFAIVLLGVPIFCVLRWPKFGPLIGGLLLWALLPAAALIDFYLPHPSSPESFWSGLRIWMIGGWLSTLAYGYIVKGAVVFLRSSSEAGDRSC